MLFDFSLYVLWKVVFLRLLFSLSQSYLLLSHLLINILRFLVAECLLGAKEAPKVLGCKKEGCPGHIWLSDVLGCRVNA